MDAFFVAMAIVAVVMVGAAIISMAVIEYSEDGDR
jgi:hypothetical protein